MPDEIDSIVEQLAAKGWSIDELKQVAAEMDGGLTKPSDSLGPTAQMQAASAPKDSRGGLERAWDVANAGASGFLDWASSGLIPAAAKKLGRNWEEEFEKKEPLATNVGRAAGGLTGGIVTGSAGLSAAKNLGVAASPVLSGVVAGGVGGGLQSGAKAASEGKGVFEAAPEMLEGAKAGAALGGAAGAVAKAGGAVADAIRDPKRLIGRTVQTLERGKRTEALDDPAFKALPEGKEGYARVADDAGQEFTELTRSELGNARGKFGRKLEEVQADAGNKAVPLDSVRSRLDALREQNTVNGVSVDEQLGKALDKVGAMITKKTGIIARESGEEITAQAGSLSDILKTKKAVQSLAEFGGPATAENRPYRLIYKELASEAEAMDPRIASMNEEFGGTMSKLERANDLVYGKNMPEVEGRAAAERTAAGRLARIGDDTTAGTVGARQMDELADLDPAYRALLEKIELKKAYERTRVGLPRISKSPEKWGGMALLEQNADAAMARGALPLADEAAAVGRAVPLGKNGQASGASVGATLFSDPMDEAVNRRKRKDKRK